LTSPRPWSRLKEQTEWPFSSRSKWGRPTKDEERSQSENDGNKGFRLLAAARRLFARQGYAGTTVEEIARAAGVGTGTFYLYFPDKPAIFHALLSDLYEQMITRVASARQATGSRDPRHKLGASVISVLRTFEDNEDLARILLLQGPGASQEFAALLEGARHRLNLLVEEDVREAGALDDTGPGPGASYLAAQAAVGSVYGTIMGWLAHRLPPDLESAGDALVGFILRGLNMAD